jgi:hypothetical protein
MSGAEGGGIATQGRRMQARSGGPCCLCSGCPPDLPPCNDWLPALHSSALIDDCLSMPYWKETMPSSGHNQIPMGLLTCMSLAGGAGIGKARHAGEEAHGNLIVTRTWHCLFSVFAVYISISAVHYLEKHIRNFWYLDICKVVVLFKYPNIEITNMLLTAMNSRNARLKKVHISIRHIYSQT